MRSRHERIAVFVTQQLFLITAICLSGSPLLSAENPYVHNGSIGDETKVAVSNQGKKLGPSDRRPVDRWTGERFIFMPMPKKKRDLVSKYLRINMMEYQGRIARVIDVTESETNDLFTSWKVKLRMEDNARILVLDYMEGGIVEGIQGIAPVMDIDDAKETWLGKTLWCKRNYLFTYNADKEEFGRVPIKKCSAVKVSDVVVGDYHGTPVRFIVKTDSGQEGFVDLSWSGTNDVAFSNEQLSDIFFVKNPRETYSWSDAVWSAIENGKVFVGMTDYQVTLSWVRPPKINKSIVGKTKHEQWIYGKDKPQYVYLDDDVVTGLQE